MFVLVSGNRENSSHKGVAEVLLIFSIGVRESYKRNEYAFVQYMEVARTIEKEDKKLC